MKRDRKDRVTVEKFVATVVRHWNARSTLTAAAAELGLTVGSASLRLKRLHKMKLQGLPRWGAPKRSKSRGIAARVRAVLAKTPAIGV
jgi:hypothetical protein